MQQWEYLGVRLIPEADGGRITVLDPLNLKGTALNTLGRQGWEVVGVFRDNFWVLLKRPVEAAAADASPNTAATATGSAPTATTMAPVFGAPDDDRARALEEKLQQELQRRQEGGGRSGRR
ncbi:MAG TPA: hypothetical protein VM536_10265 [Chloroflexia bacterium]|nr:hypothetical protein [Chloroflexia bacterium]